ncbi:MAG: hypothetical protein KDK89_09025 [Alphaproteobacteria bacterium]|nr:hypothetical protein [Alphaproteobacteria bacterium]
MYMSVCELAARLTRAPEVLVFRSGSKGTEPEILYQTGFSFDRIPQGFCGPPLEFSGNQLLNIPDVSKVGSFSAHPLSEHLPKVKSLIAANLAQVGKDEPIIILIANPEPDVFENAETLVILQVMVKMIAQLQVIPRQELTYPSLAEPPPESTHPPATAGELGATEQFLLSTLVERRQLITRNGFSFTGSRTWRSQIKPYQIEALRALKRELPESFVEVVADEIAASAKLQFGATSLVNVIPIPCGSSGKPDGFSVRIAERVATKMGCHFENILVSSAKKGSSHPKTSARLAPLQLAKRVEGLSLLVDDVASSGRHMELAMRCLRSNAIDCVGTVWIAG